MAWEIGRTRRRRRSRRASARSSTRVAAAQEPDGYLNTNFGRPGQAAALVATSSGATSCTASATCSRPPSPGSARVPDADDGLLGIARRAADLVCDVFGAGRHRSRSAGTPRSRSGSPSSAASTGEPRYLDQAALFVERRGHGHPRGHRVGPLVLPGRRAGARRDGRCAATPCAPTTSRPARSTSRSRPTTPTARRARAASGSDTSRAAPTSPAGRARTTRTRRSARTGSCRATAPTPRPAPASARSCSAGGCCSPRAIRATPT